MSKRTLLVVGLLVLLALLVAGCGEDLQNAPPSTPAPVATLSPLALGAYRIECVRGTNTLWVQDGEFTRTWETHEITRPCDGEYRVNTTFESGIDASWIEVVTVVGWDGQCYLSNARKGHYNLRYCVEREWHSLPQGHSATFDQPFVIQLWAPDGR